MEEEATKIRACLEWNHMDFEGEERKMIWFVEYYLDEGGVKPSRGYFSDAGLDIKTPIDFVVKPNQPAIIDTKLHVLIPEGYVGFIMSKSGLNLKEGILTTGVIDAGYSGSIKVKLYTLENNVVTFKRGSKIAQLVILPIETAPLKEVSKQYFERETSQISNRGDNGFGSTGQ